MTATGAESDDGVAVSGDRTVVVADTPPTRDRFGWEDREFAIHCHSGRVIEARWRGVPLLPVFEAADVAPETTHLLVTAHDGYQVCVSILAAREALLGFYRDALRVRNGEGASLGTPRFLATDLDSTEAVRDVDRVEAVSVPSGATPLEYATE
ncbi:MAG: hypothetical protein V5A43_02850 [Haloarculaceae archaeon]